MRKHQQVKGLAYIYDYNATDSDFEKYTQDFKNEIKQVNVEKKPSRSKPKLSLLTSKIAYTKLQLPHKTLRSFFKNSM